LRYTAANERQRLGDRESTDSAKGKGEEMSMPVGWCVRVTTGELDDDGYDTLLYIAGYPTRAEAEGAVREARARPGEKYDVLDEEITSDRGPQSVPSEVRLLKGAK
jgi:hypothetical protein